MGVLKKSLEPVSSYKAKKTPLWDELLDRIGGALLPLDLDELEEWLGLNELSIPYAWRESLAELIDKRRDELEAENVNAVIRDRFGFS